MLTTKMFIIANRLVTSGADTLSQFKQQSWNICAIPRYQFVQLYAKVTRTEYCRNVIVLNSVHQPLRFTGAGCRAIADCGGRAR